MKSRGFDLAKSNTYVDLKVHYLELNSISILRGIAIKFFLGMLIFSMRRQMENTCSYC